MRVSDYMKYAEDVPEVMYSTTSRRALRDPKVAATTAKPYYGKLAEIKLMNATGVRSGGTQATQLEFLKGYIEEWTHGEPHLFDRTPYQNHAIR